ncbi:MAG: hypothetical protein AMS25_14590 [Gemmatimonas sp. SM23_52]|nr:MAG: hypothetical protein AMS25_14590 [Gemmatimonas sp. SM23_52]
MRRAYERDKGYTIGRRDLLTRTVPACAMAWLGLCKLQSVGICDGAPQQQGQQQQGQHKFDVPKELTMSERQRTERENDRRDAGRENA